MDFKATPTVYTIPAGHSFADALAQGILDRTAGNPLTLTDYTILLPSRRACRTLREAFLRLSGGKAILLPMLHPIGDIVFSSFEHGVVFLHMRGACAGCPSSTATLKSGIENMLKHFIPEVEEVRAIN